MKSKGIQLFLLPFAGGSMVAFRNLVKCIDSRIEAIPIEYSGRGSRRHEPYRESYGEFLEDVRNHILRMRSRQLPYGILGYSMGGNIAYDLVVQSLLEEEPVRIFLCAKDCVDVAAASLGYYRLPDREFVEKMQTLGGIDRRIVSNERFLNIYLKPIRKDYEILGQFQYQKTSRRLQADVTVMYCEKDTPFESVAGWRNLTDGCIDFYEIGEHHFFIHDHYEKMAEIINSHLNRYL